MGKSVAFLPILGLTIDAVGAIIIVFPDIPPFKSHLLWTEEVREIRSVRDEVAGGGSFNQGEAEYSILLETIYNEAGRIGRPQEINVYIPDHPSDGGTLRFVSEAGSNSDSDLRGSIWTYENGITLTTSRVISWLENEIERKQNDLRQHYLKVGVVVLAIGFTIQAVSRASSSLHYLVLAVAASVAPFLFFHIVLDQDIEKV